MPERDRVEHWKRRSDEAPNGYVRYACSDVRNAISASSHAATAVLAAMETEASVM